MSEEKRPGRPQGGPGESAPGDLPARVSSLEEKVARLEGALARLLPSPTPPSRVPGAPRAGPRCPGCHLIVASVARGRCEWCGFVFAVVAGLKRARKRER